MRGRSRGGDGEADGDERKIDNISETASGECVYTHVHRGEEGLKHLETYI